MALAWFDILQRAWPFSALYNPAKDLKLSNRLVSKLQIPDYTKQFVFAIQDPQTNALIYILYVHRLSEISALDTEHVIRAVQPDAVVSDWSWAYTIDHDYGDSRNEPIPTSAFTVMKQCLLYKTNKDRYQEVAKNCLVKEIFGVGYEKHHLVAKKISEEIGSSFLMGSPHYFKIKPVKGKKQVDSSYKAPLFAENLYPMFTGLHGFFTLGSLSRPLASVQKLLLDVKKGGNVDTRDLSQIYNFRFAIEALRLIKYREGRCRYVHKTASIEVGKFSDLSAEEQSQYLIAQGIKAQAKKFKKIVVITDQDDWTGIKIFWNVPLIQETKGMTEKLYVSKEDSGVEFLPRTERRPVMLAAAGTVSLAVSLLFAEKMAPVYKFIRREKRGVMPWLAFTGFATWLQYGDAIVSLPAAPGIARLGHGIRSLQEGSWAIRHLRETQINEL